MFNFEGETHCPWQGPGACLDGKGCSFQERNNGFDNLIGTPPPFAKVRKGAYLPCTPILTPSPSSKSILDLTLFPSVIHTAIRTYSRKTWLSVPLNQIRHVCTRCHLSAYIFTLGLYFPFLRWKLNMLVKRKCEMMETDAVNMHWSGV